MTTWQEQLRNSQGALAVPATPQIDPAQLHDWNVTAMNHQYPHGSNSQGPQPGYDTPAQPPTYGAPGVPHRRPKRKRPILAGFLALVGGLVLLFVANAVLNPSDGSTVPPAVSAPSGGSGGVAGPIEPADDATTALPPGSFAGEGTFEVGSNVQPGKYRTAGPASDGAFPNCYWARLRDTSGDFAAIVANGNTQGQTTVTIGGSDGAFESRGCQPWQKIG